MSCLQNDLLRLTSFLSDYHPVVDTCMVTFISEDLYRVLPDPIGAELLNLSDETLSVLPSLLFSDDLSPLDGAEFTRKLILHLKSLSIDSLLEKRNSQLGFMAASNEVEDIKADLQYFDKIMPPKKTHEVQLMSAVVRRLVANNNAQFLVDLGSGKAYLSQVMSFLHNIPVLAIDSQEINTRGADARQRNLQRKWASLESRAADRKEGKDLPTRKQRIKNKLEGKTFGNNGPVEKILKLSTQFVSDDTDLGGIVEQQFSNFSHRMGIIGLHTCGNLSPSSLKIFLASKSAKFICNVGCCYHALDEEFYTNPHLPVTTGNAGTEAIVPGFPLSSVLRGKRFWLGRNARMLASQPLGRLAENKNLPSSSLFWRAVLQVILVENIPNLAFNDHRVGRIAAKSQDFVDYVRRALKKIDIEISISDEKIQDYFDKYQEEYTQKLNCFYQLRSLFAPIIEGIILLDRLLFMEESGFSENSTVVRMFDSSVSPRCYAIIGSRS